MRVTTNDFWQIAKQRSFQVLVCTTNCQVKQNGRLVMGGGIALDFSRHFPGIDLEWGTQVKRVYASTIFTRNTFNDTFPAEYLVAMPTKIDWRLPSNLDFVEEKVKELAIITRALGITGEILLPAPGCGLGGLDFNQVRTRIQPLLSDRFLVCWKPNEQRLSNPRAETAKADNGKGV